MVSSSLNWLPSSPREISKLQPLYLKSSAPPGSSTTPSSEMNSVTTILPISSFLSGRSPIYRLLYPSVCLSNVHLGYIDRRPAQRDLRGPGAPYAARHPDASLRWRGHGQRAGRAAPDHRPGGLAAPSGARARGP